MSQNSIISKMSGSFIALLCAGLLLSTGAKTQAQSYPTITGSYDKTYEVAVISSTISGAPLKVTNAVGPFTITITQNSNTFTLISSSLPGQLVGTLNGNSITSLTGPALKINPGYTATTNAMTSATGTVTNDQIFINFTGYAAGTAIGGTVFQSQVQGYIQILGAFVPLQAPTITKKPVGVTNTLGMSASFSVEASGATPLYYQWLKNGVAISGATDSTYTISTIKASDAATYTVKVSNLIGTTNSAGASLKINFPPYITTQPAKALNVALGAKATLSVKAGGTGATSYQWRLNGDDIPGATNASYTLTAMPALDGSTNLTYSVFLTNAFGTILSSNSVINIMPDKIRPKVTITSPAVNARSTNFVFSGTASDNSQIVGVTYWITNINNGVIAGSPPFTATLVGTNLSSLKWTAAPDLAAGTNVVAVVAKDLQGNLSAIATRTFFYQVPAALTLTKAGDGNGTVSGKSSVAIVRQPLPVVGTTNLYIGQSYTVQATADSKSFFTNWTTPNGLYTNATLSFIMSPGFTLQANFVTNLFFGMAGTYNGLYTNANQTDLETFGTLRNFKVDSKGIYSGQLVVNGTAYTVTGKFDMSGHAQNTIKRAAATGGPVVLDINLDWNNSPRHIFGTVSAAGTWSSQLTGDLSSNTMASAQYTMILPSAGADAQHPAGCGYLLVTNKAGSVTVSGTLGDGTPVSQTVPVSQDGRFPLFVTIYKNLGAIGGWVDLTSGSPVANLVWIKKTSPGLYPQGFTNTIPVIGSPWVKPAPKTAALPYTTNNPGLLRISGGGLTNALVFQFAALTNNTLVNVSAVGASAAPAPFTGTIDPKTGQVKLTIVNGKTPLKPTGAILQNSLTAEGVFIGRTNSGSFSMGAKE